MKRLTMKQREALRLMHDFNGEAACVAGETWADASTAYVNGNTLEALARRNLVAISWDPFDSYAQLTDDGRRILEEVGG